MSQDKADPGTVAGVTKKVMDPIDPAGLQDDRRRLLLEARNATEVDVRLLAEQKSASLERKAVAADEASSVLLVVHVNVREATEAHVVQAIRALAKR